MRILTYRSDRGPRAGLLVDGTVVDAWDALGGDGSSVRELLEADRLGELSGIDAGGGVALEDVELLPPVPDPEKIVCIGLNYRAHAAEAGIDPPDAPAIFGKYRNALVPTGAAVRLPAASDKVDYEAEVAFVIGRRSSEVDRVRRRGPHRGLHAAQRPVGSRPAVRDPAVDAGQGVRRLGSLRPGAGDRR